MQRNRWKGLDFALLCILPACTQSATPPGTRFEETINQIFSGVDRNRDGCISRGEWRLSVQSSMATLENENLANREGALTNYMEAFARLDINRDGCLTRAEYLIIAERDARAHASVMVR